MGSYLQEIQSRQSVLRQKRKEFDAVISQEQGIIHNLIIKDLAEQIVTEGLDKRFGNNRRTYVTELSQGVEIMYGISNSRVRTKLILGACDLLGVTEYYL